MFRSEEQEEEKTAAPPDTTYIGNAYGYVSSLFTPALPDCKEATQSRGLLFQYKHRATSLVREMFRLHNTIHVLQTYQSLLSEFTTSNDIEMLVGCLKRYAAIVKRIDVQGSFIEEDEKTKLLESKLILEEFISRNRIDIDLDDPDCVKLNGIIKKIQDSRSSTKNYSHEISSAILHYIMYSDLIHVSESYYRFIEWKIDAEDLQKMQNAEQLLRENSFKINAFELKFETYFTLIGLRSRVAQMGLSVEKELQKIRFEYDKTRLDISETLTDIRQLNSQRDKVDARIQRSQQIIQEEGSEWMPEAEPLLGTWSPRLS